MPRNGKLVRISLLLSAVGALAALAVMTAGAASARSTANDVNGAGSTFVQPLVTKWQGPVQQQLGINLNYNGVGSTGGVAATVGSPPARPGRARYRACLERTLRDISLVRPVSHARTVSPPHLRRQEWARNGLVPPRLQRVAPARPQPPPAHQSPRASASESPQRTARSPRQR